MDLSTVLSKIDLHQYLTAGDFLEDIDLICSNALEYNPDKDPAGELALLIHVKCIDGSMVCVGDRLHQILFNIHGQHCLSDCRFCGT